MVSSSIRCLTECMPFRVHCHGHYGRASFMGRRKRKLYPRSHPWITPSGNLVNFNGSFKYKVYKYMFSRVQDPLPWSLRTYQPHGTQKTWTYSNVSSLTVGSVFWATAFLKLLITSAQIDRIWIVFNDFYYDFSILNKNKFALHWKGLYQYKQSSREIRKCFINQNQFISKKSRKTWQNSIEKL